MSAVGRRYAKALFELGREQNATEQVLRDVGGLRAAWLESAELRELVKNPVVPRPAVRATMDALLERLGSSRLFRNTVQLLVDRGRLPFLDDILDAYEELSEAEAGSVRAEVTSAKPLSEAYYERLREKLERVTGRQIVLVRNEDPSLIGGVVTRIGDRVFDGSISNGLSELRETLLANGEAP